jgi:serine protease inhibitor
MRAIAVLIGAAAVLSIGASIPSLAQSSKDREVSQSNSGRTLSAATASPLESGYALAAQVRLASGLLRRLEQTKGHAENIVVSPASLAAVLSVLDLGADDRMRKALHRTLGFDRRSVGGAAVDLDGLRATVTNLATANSESGPLTFANAVVFDPAAAPYPIALMGLRATGAEVSVEDLSKPETVLRINEWVAARTKGLIPTILDEAPRDTGLVALNALHFKDRWRVPFDPGATEPAPFRTLDGGSIEVPMMHQSPGKFLFRQDERFVAIDLPYTSAGFAMVVVTTKDKPARAREFVRVAGWLGGDGFSESEGELALPRFSLSASAELLGALDALGLRRGRTSPTALRGLSPVPQTIARVVQRTELRVDEAGTEAAAATAVATMRSLVLDYVKMVADKPFVFALRDRQTGLILLSGYIGRPTAEVTTAAMAR